MLLFTAIGLCSTNKVSAQAKEIAQLVLDIEKLAQFKQILTDLKKGYEIIRGGYNTIKNISQGSFTLHQNYLDGLMQVSPQVRKYKRIADIINYQILLVKEYKLAFGRFKGSHAFTLQELDYMSHVYDGLFKQSLASLDELTTVITANKLRMSDDERLKAIDRIYADVLDKLLFLRDFNNKMAILAVQRAKEKNDAGVMRSIYNLKP